MTFKKLFLAFVTAAIQIVKSPETLAKAKKQAAYFTRNRKMTFENLVFFMLDNNASSSQIELNRFLKRENIHISQQAYSKARSHFDHTPFSSLLEMTVKGFYAEDIPYKTFQGYRVSAIDGTTLALPDTAENLETFGGLGVNADSPSARASIHLDILNDFIMDAQIEPLSFDERSLAKAHLEHMSCLEKELLICDRGYPSKDFIETCINKGICFLMRTKEKFCNEIDALPLGIHKFTYHGHGLKVVKITLGSGIVETLLTNLPEIFTEKEYRELYFLRWPIETKYDMLKNKLEIENFTGKTKNSILQDFYVTMYLANMLSVALAQANEQVTEARVDSDNKYSYKVNVNQAIGAFRDAFVTICLTDSSRMRGIKVEKLIYALTTLVVPIRPNRSFGRPSATRNVKFHHNRKPNR